jgi:predicted NBD/HSP70 family sugar kinase
MRPEDFVKTVHDSIKAACQASDIATTSLSGISIGIAGFVNAEENFLHWSSSIIGRNIDLGPLLSRELPCPAFIENDANLVAKAEQLFGEGKGLQNFLVVTIEYGVGLGIVLNGKLHRGERGCGAEFGHMKVHLDGAECQCGQHGCLEAYVGDYAMIREAQKADPSVNPDCLADITNAARSGHLTMQNVLDNAGQIFGMGLANLINLFDPECIILSGAQVNFDHLHSEQVFERIRKGVVEIDAPLPEFRIHDWGDQIWAKGAAAYGIEQVSILKIKELAANAA